MKVIEVLIGFPFTVRTCIVKIIYTLFLIYDIGIQYLLGCQTADRVVQLNEMKCSKSR